MRVAQTRISSLESAATVRDSGGACVDALHVSRRALRYTACVGAGIAGARLLGALWRSRRKAAPVPVALPPPPQQKESDVPSATGGLLKYLIAQLATVVLLPWLRDTLVAGPISRKIDYWRPSRIFFRWVGLEK